MRKIIYCGLFNIIVGAIGAASIAAMLAIGNHLVQAGEDFVEPIGMIAGAFLFALICNTALVAGIVHLNEEQFRHRFWRVLKWCAAFATAPLWMGVFAALVNRR